jgi:hypothetical protein
LGTLMLQRGFRLGLNEVTVPGNPPFP